MSKRNGKAGAQRRSPTEQAFIEGQALGTIGMADTPFAERLRALCILGFDALAKTPNYDVSPEARALIRDRVCIPEAIERLLDVKRDTR